jgi:hypothetical protein
MRKRKWRILLAAYVGLLTVVVLFDTYISIQALQLYWSLCRSGLELAGGGFQRCSAP